MIEFISRGRIAELTLARPPVNAINDEMITAIHGALDVLCERPDDWVVLHIRSNQGVFAAGADISQLSSFIASTDRHGLMNAYLTRIQDLYRRIEELPQVSIAEIGGTALGGGLELALSCDLRIAANEAKLGLPETSIGLIPAAGGTQRLTRLCGPGVAARMILSAESVNGETAEKWGLVQWATARSELMGAASALAERIACLPEQSLRAAKQCISAAQAHDVDGYEMERHVASTLLGTRKTGELLAAFLGKRH